MERGRVQVETEKELHSFHSSSFSFCLSPFFPPPFISRNPLISIWTSGIAARERREREIATIDLKKEFEFHLQFQTCKSLKKLLPREKVL